MRPSRGRIFVWLLRHRYAVLALNVLLIVAAGYGASRVPTDYTMEQFFPGWGPERERFDRYKLTFPKEDTRITLFWEDSRPPGLDVVPWTRAGRGDLRSRGTSRRPVARER